MESEFGQEIGKQKGEPMDKYDGLRLFLEKEISERYGKSKEDWIQEGYQTGVQTGIQTGIYNTIYRYLRLKYGDNSVSKALSEKIDFINYYPALEEVQDAAWTTCSLAAFEHKVDEIAKQYATEIQETRR